MNKQLFILAGTAILFSACENKNNSDEVVATKYKHKYGYYVHKNEWEKGRIPGEVLTTFRNGKTITETYEDTLLHGEKRITFEHSKTPHIIETYQKGILTKRTVNNIHGIPEKETVFKSPTHLLITYWHPTGSPKAKEEFRDSKLVNGQYFSFDNSTDSVITNGCGEKTLRNERGDILSKEVYVNFEIAYIETYHSNTTPHTITSYLDGRVHGEKKVFSPAGDPISVESYVHGERDGICAYYQNGFKFQESTFKRGVKEGIEKFYVDGETLIEETQYKIGLRHGPSIIYCDGSARTYWYFSNQKVSKDIFDQYEERDLMITSIH